MKFLYIIFVVVCVVYTSLSEDEDDFTYTDIRLFLPNSTEDRNCTKPGLLCTNCSKLVNCVQGEDGDYNQVLVQTCSSGQTCLRDHCTSETNPRCVKDYKFECTATGVFPDPFDCRKYHHCVAARSDSNNIEIENGTVGITTLLCDKHHSYDPITTYCKNELTDDGCPDNLYPVPICNTSGQTGALINKSIYYVCVYTGSHIIPKLYVCPHGKTYNNSRCA